MIYHTERTFYLQVGLLGLCLLWMTSCAGTPPPVRVIYEDPNRFVRLEVTSRSSQEKHQHPANLKSEDLSAILKTLTIHRRPPTTPPGRYAYEIESSREASSQAFPDQMISFLSPHLTHGLRRATPLEEVVFYLKVSKPQGFHEITSGGLFVGRDNLHILLANYRHPTMGDVELKKAQEDPQQVLALPMYDIVPGPLGKRIDPTGLKTLVIVSPQHLVFPFSGIHPTRETQTKTPSSVRTQNQLENASLRERLQELLQLKKEGLITESEFQTLRKHLLESYQNR